MIKFDPQNYPYPSKRNVVYARNGMCNAGIRTLHPLVFRLF